MKDKTWTHSVVTRPAREIIKLFEIGDTTFAEDLKAVHNAAKEILEARGASTNTLEAIEELSTMEANDEILDGTQIEENPSNNAYQSFLSCANAGDWFALDENAENAGVGENEGAECDGVEDYKNYCDELLLLV